MSQVHRLSEMCTAVPRREISDWYAWADVLVLPTISDTFGLVILEAMASGLPVITSPASGGPDVIREGIDELIVPQRCSSSIAERLDWLIRHPDRLTAMGQAARSRATEFDGTSYRRRLLEESFAHDRPVDVPAAAFSGRQPSYTRSAHACAE